jgi:hypothetical protein
MATRKATEREKEHFRRIGQIKAQLAAEELAAHLALAPAERLVKSVAMMLRGPYFPGDGTWKRIERPAIYERAERLGLYRP